MIGWSSASIQRSLRIFCLEAALQAALCVLSAISQTDQTAVRCFGKRDEKKMITNLLKVPADSLKVLFIIDAIHCMQD